MRMFFLSLIPRGTQKSCWLGLLILVGICGPVHAQLRVDIEFRRSLYLRYEPVLAFVTITNQTGQDIELADSGNHKWFSFQIETGDGRLIPPGTAEYTIDPIQIPAGQAIRRVINLTPLYPMGEYGMYRVKAAVFSAQAGRYFSSPALNVEITEGRIIWQQNVGVPEGAPGGAGTRTVTLLAHRLPNSAQLYLRIEDQENGKVFCTHQMGRYVAFGEPEIHLDGENNIHLFQNTAPRSFLYSKVSISGQVLERKQYTSGDRRPTMRVNPGGEVTIVGGTPMEALTAELEGGTPKPPVATLGDRPVPLPAGSAATPNPTPGR
jgi:hypothetical protein